MTCLHEKRSVVRVEQSLQSIPRSSFRFAMWAWCAVFVSCAVGCNSGGTGSGGGRWGSVGSPYAPLSESSRDTVRAQQLTQQAAELISKDPVKAEKLLREALTADITYGPAHNDLGVIELNRGQWYEAASEFEWARKLMPGHPDPRMNLALVFERAGRVDEALATYKTALEVYPNHIPSVQALTRLQVRSDRRDEQTNGFLTEIALAGETPKWREWAQQQLAMNADRGITTQPEIRRTNQSSAAILEEHP